jgi:hypothetical protein
VALNVSPNRHSGSDIEGGYFSGTGVHLRRHVELLSDDAVVAKGANGGQMAEAPEDPPSVINSIIYDPPGV